ncbi:PQQ-binding-like beta-propeller repeat protein [Halomicrobium salinisoli]|uniref:outer membrane protein assembly factor BamB family protein n=1 Tax=Halomicrobium salinisoli TaxID=2878391 RepID=UPI001CF03A59|nr:PQQ-binding-like beta-propeller repeat protein [Halomicrobium salinisoli]
MSALHLSRRRALASCGFVVGLGRLSGSTASSPSPVDGSWRLGRGDARNTGATSDRGPTDSATVAWRFGDHLSSRKAPVVADGDLYVGSFDDTAAFVCLDAATSDERWRTDLGGDGDVRFPDSAAAIAGDRVLAPFGERLFAFDRETGEVRWDARFEAELNAPVVADGTGYVTLTDHGSVVAFDPATGDPQWRRDVGQWCPEAVAVADGTVYTVTNREDDQGALVALDAATGTEQWRYASGQPLAGAPAVGDGAIFVGDARGVHAVTTDGDRRWRFQGRPVEEHEWHNWSLRGSSPAVADGTVYVGAADERVYAVDADTGEQQWAFWTWNNVTGAPVVTPDTVYVGSDDSVVYALDVDAGARRWEFDTTGSIDGAGGAVVDGRLYISTFRDGLYALEEP